MPLFKRLSDTFWSYVSPQKTPASTPSQAPGTAPPIFKKPALPGSRASLRDLKRKTGSMSPTSRVDSWRATGSPSPGSGSGKRTTTSYNDGTGSRKMRKLDDGTGLRRRKEDDEDDDEDDVARFVGDEEMNDDGLSSMLSNVRMDGTPTPEDFLDEYEYDSDVDVDDTEVLDDGEYHFTPNRRKIVTLPEEQEAFGVSTSEMRAAGWDDDYITLVQKIKLRGHEPLMPLCWRFSMRSMPDALFADTDDAFIGSMRNDQFRAEKALEKLLELGAQIRDSIAVGLGVGPEVKVRRSLEAYQKWTNMDAELDSHTAIPLLAVEVKPADTPASTLHANANRKLTRLADRYREAFRVLQSTETSPASRASTQYSYPLPALYAVVASHTLIAVMACQPEDGDGELDAKPVAFFDMSNPNYDVWNSLALAILLCHVRDVQARIAEETGLGVKVAGSKSRGASEDPDL